MCFVFLKVILVPLVYSSSVFASDTVFASTLASDTVFASTLASDTVFASTLASDTVFASTSASVLFSSTSIPSATLLYTASFFSFSCFPDFIGFLITFPFLYSGKTGTVSAVAVLIFSLFSSSAWYKFFVKPFFFCRCWRVKDERMKG